MTRHAKARVLDLARAKLTSRPAGRAVRRRRAAALDCPAWRWRPADRLPDLRHAQRRPLQRHPRLPRADRRPARRQRPSGDRQAGLVGDAWSAPASRSTPTASSSSAPTCSAAAWARPARPRPIRRPASPGRSTCRSSPSATWCGAQAMLIDHLGIETLFCVVGGSMGGMQVLQWAASYPERVFSALPIATAARHSAQNIAFHEVGRQAVMADPDWRGGRYLEDGTRPGEGPRRRAHGRAHHLPVGSRAAPQVRPQAAGPRQRRPSASTPISRSRAICATRA